MQAILDDMKEGDAWEVVEELIVDRAGLLAKIINEDVPQQARENAVCDLVMDLEKEEKLIGECPIDSDQTYADVMAEYVSKAMQESNFGKAYDVLKRSMELV